MTARKFTPISGLQRIFETGLIVLSLGALFLLLALLTYHPSDPGWSQTAWGGKIHNSAGAAGAWTADLCFFVFGVFAYLLPALLVFIGWSIFWRPYRLTSVNYFTLGLRLVGFLVLYLGMAGLGSMHFPDIHSFSSGGLVGDMLGTQLHPLFGDLGTTLVLLCATATGITLFTGWSWLMIAEYLGLAVTGSLQLFTQPGEVFRRLTRRPAPAEGPADFFDDEDDEDDDLAPAARFAPRPVAPAAKPAPRFTPVKRSPMPASSLDLPEDEEDDWEPAINLGALQESPTPMPRSPVSTPMPRSPAKAEADFIPVMGLSVSDDEEDLSLPWGSEQAEPLPAQPVTAPSEAALTQPLAPVVPKPRPKPLGELPSLNLLDTPPVRQSMMSPDELERIARLVEAKLADYNVQAKVVGVYPGPVITRFELELAPGMKASKITGLSRDLARSLSAVSVRVVEVIPGKPYVGLELPNRHRQTVYLKEVFDSERFRQSDNPLTMVLGQDIAGESVVVNLAKMPHVLVAGTTGSGKSVGVNVMILSMLYKATPEQVRFIMIDPKMLELSVYEGIPHLLTEVVTDMKDAANALRWCVGEMERRYKLMSAMGVRNLKGFNAKVAAAQASGNPIKDPFWRPGDSFDEEAPDLETLPSIVVIIDEFADMMMIVGKKVEELIARIAQKARAAGIHLILATQRPSVDVITGLIKANIPTRVSFQVSSKIDSRTILDQPGAESLLGMGDMLYLPAGDSTPTRVHGAFVDDHEVHKVVADWKLRGEPNYIDEILNGEVTAESLLPGEQPDLNGEELDPLFDEAVAFVVESRRGSTSSVQRRFKIGYNRAARLVDQMEAQGIVSPPGSNGQREVLAPAPMRD
ncbi:MAG: DNA translocase FtsK 4TM domain-containing protein [Aeromonadaceae bacterium]|nr:DNA translocase FtsK 4TM domain-containing protein [Aeromonadaceae bacterium]